MNPSSLHTAVFGDSGSGKSVFLNDFLTQTDPFYALTCIVDYGLSYETFTRLAGATPIILRPNGNLTINYLGTHQLPLSAEHLTNASALAAMMVGRSPDEDRQRHRVALITKYINLLYTDVFEEWSRRHPDDAMDVARLSCALAGRRAPDSTVLESFVDFRDWQKCHPDEAHAVLQQVPESEVVKALKDPLSRELVRNLAFARLSPQQQPTHSMLQELMQLDATAADREQAGAVALQLLPWCRNGNFGVLFDGVTNVDPTSRVTHFEMGQIPESAPALRTASALLVTNHSRQHTFTLDRSLRKRMIFEECSAFLNIPNAEQILREAYEQARKFNTWIVAVFQQYDRIRSSPIRAALLGNSRQFFLFKQSSNDLNALAEDLGLSRSAVETIRGFGMPDRQADGARFLCVRREHPHTVFGTVINRLSNEMLYASASGGAHFEQRRKDLAQAGPDLTQHIVEISNRNA